MARLTAMSAVRTTLLLAIALDLAMVGIRVFLDRSSRSDGTPGGGAPLPTPTGAARSLMAG